jgi:hypothetical protein
MGFFAADRRDAEKLARDQFAAAPIHAGILASPEPPIHHHYYSVGRDPKSLQRRGLGAAPSPQPLRDDVPHEKSLPYGRGALCACPIFRLGFEIGDRFLGLFDLFRCQKQSPVNPPSIFL